jgi:hypothetical protein
MKPNNEQSTASGNSTASGMKTNNEQSTASGNSTASEKRPSNEYSTASEKRPKTGYNMKASPSKIHPHDDAEVFSSIRSFLPQRDESNSSANAKSPEVESKENPAMEAFYTQTIFDGGANLHLTGIGRKATKSSMPLTIQTAGGAMHSTGEAEILLNDRSYRAQSLPSLGNKNLISASRFLQEHNAQALLTPTDGVVFDPKSNNVTHSLVVKNGVYVFEESMENYGMFSAHSSQQSLTYHQLHTRYGHCHDNALLKIIGGGNLPQKDPDYFCKACAKGKLVAKRFKEKSNNVNQVLHIVHSDTVGPIRPASIEGEIYWTSFMDGHSNRSIPMFQRRRAETTKQWIANAKREQRRMQRDISIFRHDNAKEFECEEISNYMEDEGILSSRSERYDPRTNGKPERFNRTINSKARCLLFEAGLPSKFWGRAVRHAVFLYNHTPRQQKATKDCPWRTPQGLYEGKDDAQILSRIQNIPTFGELGYALIHKPLRDGKFTGVSEECIFMGIEEETNYPIVYLLEKGEIQAVRTVKFSRSFLDQDKWKHLGFDIDTTFEEVEDEDYVPTSEADDDEEYIPQAERSYPEQQPWVMNEIRENNDADLTDVQSEYSNEQSSEELSTESPTTTSAASSSSASKTTPSSMMPSIVNERPTRQTALNSRLLIQLNNEDMHDIDSQLMTLTAIEETDDDLLNIVDQFDVPKSWEDALNDDRWKISMHEEIDTLNKMGTWELVDLPPGRKAIKNKWAFKLKQNEKGEIYKFKSRLTACGYSQIEHVDYEDTYAAVGNRNTLRFIVSIAACKGLQMRQIDFESAFLQGELKEEIYMQQPSGFSDGTERVCRLRKSLYGLKQSSAVWYDTISKFIISMGYEVSKVDQCLFLQNKDSQLPSFIFLYVDDMLILSDSVMTLNEIVNRFQTRFSIKDLGSPRHILGIELLQTPTGIWIGQRSFAVELIRNFLNDEARPISSPCLSYPEESYDYIGEALHERYRSLVGGILYLAQVTRPDLAFISSLLGKFVSKPAKIHWNMAIRCLRYIKYTLDEGIFYKRDVQTRRDNFHDLLEFYSDSDYAGDPLERRSRSGVLCELNGTAIYWKSKQHHSISLSSCEAEYYAIVDNMKEAIVIRLLAWELQNVASFPGEDKFKGLDPILIKVDNTSAIKTTQNASISDSMKHVQVRYHWIKEKVRTGDLQLQYVRTEANDADIFTKPLNGVKMRALMRRIGMLKRSSVCPEEKKMR